MRYSLETVRKIMATLRALIAYYMGCAYDTLRVRISTGNRKIGRVHNFSMAPGVTCANCSGCLRWCYDVKACLQYENVRIARAINTAMMYMNMAATFQQIDNYISRKRARKFFRWHVSGDILNVEYFDFMVEIARRHPDWIFWTYTKNYAAVNAWVKAHGGNRSAVPANLSVMFSVWNGMPCINPYGFPEFTCIMDGMEPAPGAHHCPGNCDLCIESGHGCPFGQSSYTFPH